jgi:hypothetical protein
MLRFLLYLGAVCMLATIVLTLAHHYASPWLSVCDLYDHHLGFFVDGMILAALVAWLAFGRSTAVDKGSLAGILLHPQTIAAMRLWMVLFWASCGTTKFIADETIDFFHSSGYSTAFFFFIATWEFAWGLALISRRTAVLALSALTIDMVGAIYTHFHNYFTRGFPGPFGNSVDALRMLGLMAYVGFAVRRTHKERIGSVPVERVSGANV